MLAILFVVFLALMIKAQSSDETIFFACLLVFLTLASV